MSLKDGAGGAQEKEFHPPQIQILFFTRRRLFLNIFSLKKKKEAAKVCCKKEI